MGSMRAGFDGAERHAKPLGNFCVGKSFEVGKPDHFSFVRRQRVDGLADRPNIGSAFVLGINGEVGVVLDRIETRMRTKFLPPQNINGCALDEAEHPRRRISRRVESFPGVPHGQKSVLHGFLGERCAVEDPPGHSDRGAAMVLIQHPNGFGVPTVESTSDFDGGRGVAGLGLHVTEATGEPEIEWGMLVLRTQPWFGSRQSPVRSAAWPHT